MDNHSTLYFAIASFSVCLLTATAACSGDRTANDDPESCASADNCPEDGDVGPADTSSDDDKQDTSLPDPDPGTDTGLPDDDCRGESYEAITLDEWTTDWDSVTLTEECGQLFQLVTVERPVELTVSGSATLESPDGMERATSVPFCLHRVRHTRSWGLNEDSDYLAGWSRDELDETPTCGFYRPGDGHLEPMGTGEPLEDLRLLPGQYLFQYETAESDSEWSTITAEYDVDRTNVGDAVCGDGARQETSAYVEECDDGNRDPLDPCSARCRWNWGLLRSVEEEETEPNDPASKAFDLEGFRHVQLMGSIVYRQDGERDDVKDVFETTYDSGMQIEVTAEQCESPLQLTIEHFPSGSTPYDGQTVGVCESEGTKTLSIEESGTYYIELAPEESLSGTAQRSYDVEIEPTGRVEN
jgi:cysteine-rich repeat protein